jgi:hypothetical protein
VLLDRDQWRFRRRHEDGTCRPRNARIGKHRLCGARTAKGGGRVARDRSLGRERIDLAFLTPCCRRKSLHAGLGTNMEAFRKVVAVGTKGPALTLKRTERRECDPDAFNDSHRTAAGRDSLSGAP